MKSVVLWCGSCLMLVGITLAGPGRAEDVLKYTAIQGSVNSSISAVVLRKAWGTLGVTLDIQPLPAARALHVSNAGDSDGELFRIAGVEKKYPNLIPVDVPVNFLEAAVLTRGRQLNLRQWQDVDGYRVVVRRGVKFTERGTAGMDVVVVETNADLAQMLIRRDQIDLGILARVNALSELQQFGKKAKDVNLHIEPAMLEEYPLYTYLHKSQKTRISLITPVLQAMFDRGEIRQIREDYIANIFH